MGHGRVADAVPFDRGAVRRVGRRPGDGWDRILDRSVGSEYLNDASANINTVLIGALINHVGVGDLGRIS